MSKFQKLIVSFLILLGIIIIVSLGMYGYNKFVEVKDKTIGITDSVFDMEFDAIDGKSVPGSEVLSVISKLKNTPQFSILVKTGTNAGGFYGENTSSDSPVAYTPGSGSKVGAPGSVAVADMGDKGKMKDKSNIQYYINQSAMFKGKVYRDDSGEARLIVYTQAK